MIGVDYEVRNNEVGLKAGERDGSANARSRCRTRDQAGQSS
jgi:hypothetical protein